MSIINDDSTSPAIWDMNQSDSAGKLLPASSGADEFVSFAEWAFGPTGLPILQILDLGDFSDKDRFQKQCLIRRRCHEKERRYEVYQRPGCGHEPDLSHSFIPSVLLAPPTFRSGGFRLMELGFFLLVQPTGQLNHLLNGRKVIISTATHSPLNSWKLHVKLCSVGGILAFLSCGGQKNEISN